ncbi:MAG: hypothetical protein R6U62_08365 [Bacteroidales bacterium]
MRRAIVTGAYGAIGKAIARGVAEHVTLAGRDEGALEACRKELIKQTGNENISHMAADLHKNMK